MGPRDTIVNFNKSRALFPADQIPYGVMSITVLLIKILEFMFVAGWIGSAIVLVLTGIEDVGTMLDRKDENSH
ncbi:MAG: hypothetical protein ABSG02_02150 [Terriglobales bacterium]|jgi:hypothetical protein